MWLLSRGDCRGRDRMVVGFTTTCVISVYHHWCCEFESWSWWGVLDTTLWDKVCQWLTTGLWFSTGTPVSSTNKTDCHDITEILVKVALSTTKQTNKHMFMCMLIYHSQWHHYEYIIFPLYIFSPMLFIYFVLVFFKICYMIKWH